MKLFFATFLIIFLSVSLSAQTFPRPVDPHVNDFASVLNTQDQSLLQSFFTRVFENTSVQVVFVSLSTIGDESIDSYAISLGESWGVGDAAQDRGLVILYVADINKIFIATGYGVEGILPDSKLGRFLDTYYVPLRDSGNVSEGIVVLSAALSDELIQHADEMQSPKNKSSFWIILIILFVIILILIILISYSKHSSGNRWTPIFIPSGGSSSGGFGGFGGGSFGGGGAGR